MASASDGNGKEGRDQRSEVRGQKAEGEGQELENRKEEREIGIFNRKPRTLIGREPIYHEID
jgi:hypothetical protein